MINYLKRFLKVKKNNSVNVTYIDIIGPATGCL